MRTSSWCGNLTERETPLLRPKLHWGSNKMDLNEKYGRQEIHSSGLEMGQMASSCKESNESTTLRKRTLLHRVRSSLISVMPQWNPKFKRTICMYSHRGSNLSEYS